MRSPDKQRAQNFANISLLATEFVNRFPPRIAESRSLFRIRPPSQQLVDMLYRQAGRMDLFGQPGE
jgi:hypothetical protein